METCPKCGYCPHCGKSNTPLFPYNPLNPYWQIPTHYTYPVVATSGYAQVNNELTNPVITTTTTTTCDPVCE